MEEKIEIPLSKTKIILTLIAAMVFVVLGIIFILNPEDWKNSMFNSTQSIRIVGTISVIFFGICSIFIFRKLFDNEVGLIIDQYGITENTNATSVGLIEWDDIKGIEKIEIASNKILLLFVNNPEKYIAKSKNGFSKRAMKANNTMYGTPISIISNSLKIKFKDLEKLVISEMEKRKG